MDVLLALVNVVGSVFSLILIHLAFESLWLKLLGRVLAGELRSIAIKLRMTVQALDYPENADESIAVLLERNSPDLIRNRISDFLGSLATGLFWIASAAEVIIFVWISWTCWEEKSLDLVGMWLLPVVQISLVAALSILAISSYLLTGRIPGQARRTRNAALAS
ncbi:hypothetical protein H7A76_08775 [Pseudomonas sp. MSSRFD41]|uniref:hypothetical protein n=1 Tax=Pseudomonas sp. MSSRFD41 TaxID=1310370 RepID=UPI00163B5C64|nr:hypothetical protein [Pseudomonas sp. MSSRFD41]MBC2655530.1 hypothetical protein [Pseudomonas sp. MSSRFD41]